MPAKIAPKARRQKPAGSWRCCVVGADRAQQQRQPANTSGHRMKTWPWMDSDQKCCSGLAPEWSWA